jgi:lipopolysaccharide biosynthesis protein
MKIMSWFKIWENEEAVGYDALRKQDEIAQLADRAYAMMQEQNEYFDLINGRLDIFFYSGA